MCHVQMPKIMFLLSLVVRPLLAIMSNISMSTMATTAQQQQLHATQMTNSPGACLRESGRANTNNFVASPTATYQYAQTYSHHANTTIITK